MKSKPDRSHYLYSNNALKALILPLVLEQALSITVGMADSMMVSRLGEAAVSGVSLVDMINMLMFQFFAALATGGAVIVSQNLGAKRLDSARESAKQMLFAVLVLSTVLAVLALVFKNQLLSLFFGKIEPDVRSAGLTYLTISVFSFPFLGMYNSCAAIFRSMGKSSITFTVSIIGNIINVAGNALCIFGLKMGVEGVAIPTLLSRMVMGIILFVLLHNTKHEVHFTRDKFRIRLPIIRNILYLGIPGGIENGIFQLGRVLVMSIVSGFDTMSTTAMSVSNVFGGFGCIIGQAMNLSMVAVIGKCVGADDKEQIKYYLKKLMAIVYIGTAAINIILLSCLNPLLSLYELSPETRELTYRLIMIHDGLAIFLWPMSFTFPNMLRACNDVRFTMVASVVSMFVFRIGFSYLMGITLGMGVVGVQFAMIIDWICRITCFSLRYKAGCWQRTMYRLS